MAMSVIQQSAESYINSENTVILMRGKCRKTVEEKGKRSTKKRIGSQTLSLTE